MYCLSFSKGSMPGVNLVKRFCHKFLSFICKVDHLIATGQILFTFIKRYFLSERYKYNYNSALQSPSIAYKD